MEQQNIKIGTRSSRLALTQTADTVARLASIFPALDFETFPFSSPGDRDRQTDLKLSDPDFFTRDLDDAVINGDIDAAMHSAKDLPDVMNSKLDWLWLPWHEDQRDVLIGNGKLETGNSSDHPTRATATVPSEKIAKSPNPRICIGVSSARREEYCRQRFSEADLLPIRGNIEDRIAQLDEGEYDLLIMAAAGLKRLGLQERISEYIPLTELPPPPGQGYLAITFRKGDQRFEIMRSLFIHPVIFAGSGPGNPELATVACVNALKHCDICLYDSLAPDELLKNIPENAQAIYVGKRSGQHSKKQTEICGLITSYSRQGKVVVRLKGGDAGIFGRLAEEVEALDELSLTYQVIPGISSLQSASAETGMLLTRRGTSRGFSVMTPRKEGSAEYQAITPEENLKFPRVYFMGKSVISQIIDDLLAEKWQKDVPAAVIFSAGTDDQFIISGTIANIAEKTAAHDDNNQPGLLIVGPNADEKYLYKPHGAMAGRKIMVTCSEALQEKALGEIRRFGGKPILMPMIRITATPSFVAPSSFNEIDYLLLTSPTAVKIFFNLIHIDLRQLPKIMVCGPGTACEFRQIGINPDLIAEDDFGVSGLIKVAEKHLKPGTKILRLCSDQASEELSCELRKLGCEVTDQILYHNTPHKYETLPEFDAVIFASSSGVKAFIDNFGSDSLGAKILSVLGQPTLNTVKQLIPNCKTVVAREATIPGTVNALAEYYVNEKY